MIEKIVLDCGCEILEHTVIPCHIGKDVTYSEEIICRDAWKKYKKETGKINKGGFND